MLGDSLPLVPAWSKISCSKKALPTFCPWAEKRGGGKLCSLARSFWVIPDHFTGLPNYFTYPFDLGCLATQRLLTNLGSPGSQLTLEDQEGLLSQVDLVFQLTQGDLCLLFDPSFQDALNGWL